MSSWIMTGNKSVVRVVVYALILCFLLVGCFGKTDSYEDNGTGNETVCDIATGPTGTTGTISAIIDEEETQSDTRPLDNTMLDDVFTTEAQNSVDSVPSTESTEMPPNSIDATTPGNEDNNIPSYSIELPDDNWD